MESQTSGVVPRNASFATCLVPVWEPVRPVFVRETIARSTMYPKAQLDDGSGVPSQPSFPKLEEQVLAYWEADRTFKASVDAREPGQRGSNEYVFYDGPPFANGLPHYGHLLTGYVKDIVPRYQTMKGKRVERRFG